MDKRFERYFGSNIGRKIYIASIAVIAFGLILGWAYWWGYGVPIAAIGVAGFFVSYGIQVSDKDVDEHVANTVDAYAKEKIEGKTFGKGKYKSEDFSTFFGYIRNDSKTRFVAGSDGRIRTSKYYVTAISADNNQFTVFTSVYDLLSNEPPIEDMMTTKGAENIEFSTENTDFPSGNKKCTLKADDKELVFYLPNDALADKLIAKIK